MRPDRLDVPRWIHGDPLGEYGLDAVGGDPHWCHAVPAIFRYLASPETERLPRPPSLKDDWDAQLGYWTAIVHVLVYSFGWAYPSHGLLAWRDLGRPTTGDPRFELLGQYEQDGLLDLLIWSLLEEDHLFSELRALLADTTGYERSRPPIEVDRDWHDRVSQFGSYVETAPHSTHLNTHCLGPLQGPGYRADLIIGDDEQRRAVLVTDSMVGWYRELARLGSRLPKHRGRAWRVDVVVRPAGYLGSFRRSWETGMWFSGEHRYHTLGA